MGTFANKFILLIFFLSLMRFVSLANISLHIQHDGQSAQGRVEMVQTLFHFIMTVSMVYYSDVLDWFLLEHAV